LGKSPSYSAIDKASWKLLDPLLQAWEQRADAGLAVYPAGSWGPAEADLLLARDDRGWRLGCEDAPGIIHAER